MIFPYRGIEVYYEESGAGEALVLLHGFLESSAMWEPLVAEFKHSHRVICLDLLGHGQTDCLGYIHTMEDMAHMVVALLGHLQVSKAKFIGHSMGGYVALALNHSHPDLIDGLCLMNSTFEADSNERRLLRERAIEMAKVNYENLIKLSFANLFAIESRTTFKHSYENALAIALNTPVQGYIAAQKGMQLRADHRESFLKIRGGKALIYGTKDSLINGEQLEKNLSGQPINICKLSGGHMSHIEDLSNLSYFLLRFI
jgi:pimeloyl-ACP methyl ester carboxylesterase